MFLECRIGTLPFIYLGLLVGANSRLGRERASNKFSFGSYSNYLFILFENVS
jgi:hypothetical protein